MKVILLCALLIASVYADASHDEAVELIQRHLKNVPPVHETVSELFALAHAVVNQERSNPSGSCLIALGQALNDGCFPNVTASFDPATDPVCTSTCDADYTAIYTQCADSFDTNAVSSFTFWRSVLCLKAGDTYCYATFQQLPAENAVLTKANLDAVCSPCFAKLLNAIAAFSNAQANPFNADALFFFDLICTKSPAGDYCGLEFQNNGGSPVPACVNTQFGDLSFTGACLDSVCQDGCARRLLTKLWLKYGDLSQGIYFKVLRLYLCSKNPDNNQYCLIAWSAATAAGPPQNCQATRNVAGTLGCCLGSFYELLLALSNDTALLISQAASTCSVQIGDPCPKPTGTGSLVGKIVVSIKYSWAAGAGDALKAALKADLAAFFGVSEDDVVITDVADFGKKRSAGTAISFTASSEDASSTQNLVSQLNSNGANIVFHQTGTLYGAQNPGQTVEVNSVSAEYSSAASLGASMLALVAALLVLLY